MPRANVEGLDPKTRIALTRLLDEARKKGIPVDVTSAYRTADEQAALIRRYKAGEPGIYKPAPVGHSPHEKGNAADLSVPPKYRKQFTELAQGFGFKWGGAADPVHYTYTGSAGLPTRSPLDPDLSRARAMFGRTRDKQTQIAGDHKKVDSDLAKAQDLFSAPLSPSKVDPDIAKAQALFGKPTKASSPTATPASRTKAKTSQNPLLWAGALGNATNAYLNAMAEQGAALRAQGASPFERIAAFPGAIGEALQAGVGAFGPEPVTPTGLRTALGVKKGETPRGAYNTAAVLDYALSMAVDPTALLMGPLGKGAQLAASPITRPIAAAVRGGQAQAGLMKAMRAREAAETAYSAASAGGAGKQTLAGLGREFGAARAVEQAARAGVTQAAQGAGKVGVAVARSKPGAAVLRVEQAAQAHARQEASKLTQGWLRLVGLQKGALLSRPSTAITNSIGPFIQSEQELRRVRIPVATWMARAPEAAAELRQFTQTGVATGDVAELVRLVPGILGNPAATAGVKAGRNPLLRVQGAADDLAKVQLFKVLRPKLGPTVAAERVKTVLFNYSDLPALLRSADKYGLWLFGSFSGAAAKSFADAIVRRPDLVARFPRLREQLLNEFPGSREAYEKLRSYEKGPFTFPIGKDRFVDVGRYHPWGAPLGLLEEAQRVREEGFTPRPPGQRDIGSTTILSPSISATRKVPQGAPAGEGWRQYLLAELANRVPAWRDFQRLRAAWSGTSMSDRVDDEPQSKAAAVGQALLGVSTVRGETRGERRDRLGGAINRRMSATDRLEQRLENEFAAGKLALPRVGAGMNEDDLAREFRAAMRYYSDMMRSPKNVSAAGQITPEGRRRITGAFLRVRALERAVNALGR